MMFIPITLLVILILLVTGLICFALTTEKQKYEWRTLWRRLTHKRK